MMRFSEIIRNAGLDVSRFPNCANIHIRLYDGKDRVSSEESVEYVRPLFVENPNSLKQFFNFLTGLEKENVTSMNVKVDVDSVVLFYQNPRAKVFPRKKTMDPIDYMD